jgi:ribosome-binding factor A
MPYRPEKFASTLRQALGEIFTRDSLNPDFKFVSITHVSFSIDLKKADIFIATSSNSLENVLRALNRSKGFIKRQLAKKMILRFMPELNFIEDKGFLEQKFSGLRKEKDHENTNR